MTVQEKVHKRAKAHLKPVRPYSAKIHSLRLPRGYQVSLDRTRMYPNRM